MNNTRVSSNDNQRVMHVIYIIVRGTLAEIDARTRDLNETRLLISGSSFWIISSFALAG